MECLSPNIHVPDLSAGPRKKRFQVHAACTQCKKSHAACSMTRPCERCVRVGEAHLCVDMPRKRRGKHANQLLQTQHAPLDPSPTLSGVPEDPLPIDEISDFLFDGLENHLLADNTLRNVSLLEGSALNASTILHTRPLFTGVTPQYGAPTIIPTMTSPSFSNSPSYSSSSSSGTPSPVPTSPYSPNTSPLPYIQQTPNGYTNYTPTNSSMYNILQYTTSNASPDSLQALNTTSSTLQTIHVSPNSDLYSDQEYHPTDEALINAHITSLLSGHIPPPTDSPSTTSTSSTTSTTTSTSSFWPDPDAPTSTMQPISPLSPSNPQPISPSVSNLQLISPSLTQTREDSSPGPTTTNGPNSSPNGPKEDVLERLMALDARGVGAGACDMSKCSMPQCFCYKNDTGKVHIVCASTPDVPDTGVAETETPIKPDPTNSLHLVVESLVREVQNLKKELRGDASTENVKIGKVGYASAGPAVAVWDLVDQRLLECNETFAALFCVDPSQPLYLTDIAQCPAYFLRLCSTNKTSWHEKRRYSLKRPEGDINLVIAIDINGTCVVTTVWKAG